MESYKRGLAEMQEYSDAFLKRIGEQLGGEYPAFMAAMGETPRSALRLNPLRPQGEAALEGELGDPVPWEPWGRYALPGFKPGEHLAHFAGAFYSQEASAMAPARVLSPRPGERVLDLCAAPGGKSGQLAAMLEGRGALVSNEPDFHRAQILRGNLERLGAAAAAVVCALPQQLAQRWPAYFDAVLVDAPCSGEGMFRRDPQARAEWSPQRAAGCARRQREILAQAAAMVRPGGRLVYSTCTFNPQENRENVAWVLERFPDFQAGSFALPGVGASQDGCLELWPHRIAGEGHFVALLLRRGGERADWAAPAAPAPEAKRALALLKGALPGAWHAPFAQWDLSLRGEILTAQPRELPRLEGVRTLSAGLALAQVGKGWVKPLHALAMAAPAGSLERVQAVDREQALTFLKGETLVTAQEGWTLVTWQGLPLGWGKGVAGTLKNHLPKGLLRR